MLLSYTMWLEPRLICQRSIGGHFVTFWHLVDTVDICRQESGQKINLKWWFRVHIRAQRLLFDQKRVTSGATERYELPKPRLIASNTRRAPKRGFPVSRHPVDKAGGLD